MKPKANEDFYRFVNHKWLKETKIPKDARYINTFSELNTVNKKRMIQLINKTDNAVIQKIKLQYEQYLESGVKYTKHLPSGSLNDKIVYLIQNGSNCPFNLSIDVNEKNTKTQKMYLYLFNQNRISERNIESLMSHFFPKSKIDIKQIVEFQKDLNFNHKKEIKIDIEDIKTKSFSLKTIFKKLKIKNTVCYSFDEESFHKLDDLLIKTDNEVIDMYFNLQFIQTYMNKMHCDLTKTITNNTEHELDMLFVSKYFDMNSKESVEGVIRVIMEKYKEALSAVKWLGDDSKIKANKKVQNMTYKVGYPEHMEFRDRKTLGKNLLETYINWTILKFQEEIESYNNGVINDKWEMKAYMVNAYYHPLYNEIVFPAGILQKPFYDPKQTIEENLAGIGTVIGHEISHSNDSSGSRFNHKGNMRKWWKDDEIKKFDKIVDAITKHYDKIVIHDFKVDGWNTRGENISDIGGALIAMMALKDSFEYKSASSEKKDDMLRNFFESYASIEKCKNTCERLENQILNDVHSPSEARVNGVLQMFDDFHRVYNIQEGDNMFLKKNKRNTVF